MPKFCGKCGSPLDENGLCPKCAPTQKEIRFETDAVEYDHMEEPIQNEIKENIQIEQPLPKKKKSKLVPIIIAAAAVAVVGALVFCAFFFHWFGLGGSDDGKKKSATSDGYVSSLPNYFVKTDNGLLCNSLFVDNITEDFQDQDKVTLKDNEGKKVNLLLTGRDGNTFYGPNADSKIWYKFTLESGDSCESETWFDEDALSKSILKFENNGKTNYASDIRGFTVDGDWVYARVLGDSVFYTAHKALNHRLIRASKDGKKIEFVGGEDVRAVDFVVNDGWIYYADNGYVCEGNLFSFDYSRVGIYKMKTDGSEKTRIFDKFDEMDRDKYYKSGNAFFLTIYNGKLYFCDLSDNSSRIASINLDGSDYRQLSSEGAKLFTIDADNNEIYYQVGNALEHSPDPTEMKKMKADGSSEQRFSDRLFTDYTFNFKVYDGYLYFQSSVKDKPVRIKISDGKAQVLELKEPKQVLDKEGYPVESGSPEVKWTDLDSSEKL